MNKTKSDEFNQKKIDHLLIARASLLETILDVEEIARDIDLSNEEARTIIKETIFAHLDVMVKRGYLSVMPILDASAFAKINRRQGSCP